MADMANVNLQWQIEQRGRFGEGISRAPVKARTKPFRLHVKPVGQSIVKLTLQAETKAKAVEYALARWPGAEVEVV